MYVSIGCQSELSTEKLTAMENEVQELRNEVNELREKVWKLKEDVSKHPLSASELQKDNNKLKFYTGIHEWCVFQALLSLIAPVLPDARIVSRYVSLLIFFLKVRLNLFDDDIAYRFGIHPSTVSRHFHHVLDVLHVHTAFLLKWPDRETLHLTMPTAFRRFFKKCAVIIDCTEVFIERPSDLLARAQVWSNYKHHSTVKFLIGITPKGTISFVSKCAGGRMSDKDIVEQSGLIEHLLPGMYTHDIATHACLNTLSLLFIR